MAIYSCPLLIYDRMHFITFFIITMSYQKIFCHCKKYEYYLNVDYFPVFCTTGDNLMRVVRLCFFLKSFTEDNLLTDGKRGNRGQFSPHLFLHLHLLLLLLLFHEPLWDFGMRAITCQYLRLCWLALALQNLTNWLLLSTNQPGVLDWGVQIMVNETENYLYTWGVGVV